jgi:hypothetical protein
MFDFELFGDLASSLVGNVSYGDEVCFGDEAAEVFCVTLAHLSNAKNADSQLSHSKFSVSIATPTRP